MSAVRVAADEKLDDGEVAIFLAREWFKDNGASIRKEIQGAHDFVVKYALLDLNRTNVPVVDGTDELLETMPYERIVRRMGTVPSTGSYVSSSGNLDAFATYGNAVGVAKVHMDKASALRDQAKSEKAQREKGEIFRAAQAARRERRIIQGMKKGGWNDPAALFVCREE